MNNTGIKYRYLIFLMFAASGFTGLIYESIWTHYLKLFLGHAAFAQYLVLSIFMGGLAFGSWIAAKKSYHFRNPFLIYAIIELIIGFIGLFFHSVYGLVTDFAYFSLFPSIENTSVISISKWFIAAILILPQSILLGMTFPTMSAGFIRSENKSSGRDIATLYFTNSIGAAIGVLVSGFILIASFGLPGTISTAGLINIIIAAIIYILTRHVSLKPKHLDNKSFLHSNAQFQLAILSVAFFTGCASFLYELSWIRMLSLVLGASTHSFELMLSAFILGIALGSLWIRYQLKNIKNPITYLAYVQISMGFLALLTLSFYNKTFDFMSFALSAFSNTEAGYMGFNFISHLISLIIMLPATICAGMTLPLLTHILLDKNKDESAVGKIYASNTIGSISGIIIAASFGFLYLGTKGIIILGAIIDISIGLLFLYFTYKNIRNKKLLFALASSFLFIIFIATTVHFDPRKMSSSVYRTEFGDIPKNEIVKYYRDGRTASVSLTIVNEELVIRSNGKPDASINLSPNGKPTIDEPTMILAAALGLAYQPEAKNVANIGIGSGLTSHTLLGSPKIKQLDTIEIENLMVEAAHSFGKKVERTFNDARSNIIITDAKSYFSSKNKVYDIIISEPSNPWVSGISSLFTKEFYHQIKHYLSDDGIFIQWLHMYETNQTILSSVIKAFSTEMSDYAIYSPNNTDMLIIGKKVGKLPPLSNDIFLWAELMKSLHHLKINSVADFQYIKIGEKSYLDPFFIASVAHANSDYYPYVDLHAVKARYLKSNAYIINNFTNSSIPFVELLDKKYLNYKYPVTRTSYPQHKNTIRKQQAYKILEFLKKTNKYNSYAEGDVAQKIRRTHLMLETCNASYYSEWVNSTSELIMEIIPSIPAEELKHYWEVLKKNKCYNTIYSASDFNTLWLDFLYAQSMRDTKNIRKLTTLLLDKRKENKNIAAYLLASNMLASIYEDDFISAFKIWEKHQQTIPKRHPLAIQIKAMTYLSIYTIRNKT